MWRGCSHVNRVAGSRLETAQSSGECCRGCLMGRGRADRALADRFRESRESKDHGQVKACRQPRADDVLTGVRRFTRPDPPHARRRYAHRLGHRRAAPVRGVGRGLLHGLRDHLRPDLPRQRRHPRGPPSTRRSNRWRARVSVSRLPAPDRRLRHARPPHDLGGAPTVRGRHHDARRQASLRGVLRLAIRAFSSARSAGPRQRLTRGVASANHPTTDRDGDSCIGCGTPATKRPNPSQRNHFLIGTSVELDCPTRLPGRLQDVARSASAPFHLS